MTPNGLTCFPARRQVLYLLGVLLRRHFREPFRIESHTPKCMATTLETGTLASDSVSLLSWFASELLHQNADGFPHYWQAGSRSGEFNSVKNASVLQHSYPEASAQKLSANI